MADERLVRVAKFLIGKSASAKAGELVRVSASTEALPLATECYKEILRRGANPVMQVTVPEHGYWYYKLANDRQLKYYPKHAEFLAKRLDADLRIGGIANTKDLSSIDSKKIAITRKVADPLSKILLKKKWVLFHYPTNALAQDAELSLPEFEDFVYNATLQDYRKINALGMRIKKRLDKAHNVRIIGKNTDLKFSVKGKNTVVAAGEHNVPDGEAFTAPVETSAEGFIEYDYPAIYAGKEVSGIRLEFKKGKVVKASAQKNGELLKKLIKMDKGACRLGELGIGTNPAITRFTKQILFDEKMFGTVHLALGNAYTECKGKNKSALHWDMIKDLRNGGKLLFDDKTIMKNGKFKI